MSPALPGDPSRLSPEDFSALAASLQEMAETVLAMCRVAQKKRQQPQAAAATSPGQTPAPPYRQDCQPAQAARREQDLLEQCQAHSLPAALNEIYLELYTTIVMMKNYSYEDDEPAFHMDLLGVQLERALAALRKACSILAEYVPMPEGGTTAQ